MKHCLFAQWKKPTDASKYVIDGTVYEYTGTELQDKIMKILAEVPQFKEICSNKKKENLSPCFRCSYCKTKNSILHFIEGNFEETDFAGRKMVYIFMTSENDSSKIVEILKNYSALLGVTPHNEDLEIIKNQKFPSKRALNAVYSIKSIIWTIISTIIFLLLYMLKKTRIE